MENFNDGMNEVFYPNVALDFMACHLLGLPSIFFNKCSKLPRGLKMLTQLSTSCPFAPHFLILFPKVIQQPERIKKLVP